MKIRDFLKIKGRPVITIKPDEVVSAAIQKLIKNNIGALPVCNDNDELVGIISERDLLKECSRHGCDIGTNRVQGVMTRRVAVGSPEDEVDYATSVMKQERIRHLPIVVDRKIMGIVSMRDIVDMQLEETMALVRYVGLLPRKTTQN